MSDGLDLLGAIPALQHVRERAVSSGQRAIAAGQRIVKIAPKLAKAVIAAGKKLQVLAAGRPKRAAPKQKPKAPTPTAQAKPPARATALARQAPVQPSTPSRQMQPVQPLTPARQAARLPALSSKAPPRQTAVRQPAPSTSGPMQAMPSPAQVPTPTRTAGAFMHRTHVGDDSTVASDAPDPSNPGYLMDGSPDPAVYDVYSRLADAATQAAEFIATVQDLMSKLPPELPLVAKGLNIVNSFQLFFATPIENALSGAQSVGKATEGLLGLFQSVMAQQNDMPPIGIWGWMAQANAYVTAHAPAETDTTTTDTTTTETTSTEPTNTVPGSTVAKVVVLPIDITMALGLKQQFSLSVFDVAGKPTAPKTAPTWSIAPAGATVDQNGRVSAQTAGQYTISVTVDGIPGSATLTVQGGGGGTGGDEPYGGSVPAGGGYTPPSGGDVYTPPSGGGGGDGGDYENDDADAAYQEEQLGPGGQPEYEEEAEPEYAEEAEPEYLEENPLEAAQSEDIEPEMEEGEDTGDVDDDAFLSDVSEDDSEVGSGLQLLGADKEI